MKKKLITSFLFLFVGLTLSAQSTTTWTEKKATKWFKKKEYLNGFAGIPLDGIDKVQFAQHYEANKALWDKAFEYLKNTNLQGAATGRVPIDGDNVYAVITEVPTKDYDKTAFESHRNYIDLHYMIAGEEKMSKTPWAPLPIDRPYNERGDITYYAGGEGPIYTVPQNSFMIFFPSDGHRANITPGGNKVVKKVVVKIRFAKN